MSKKARARAAAAEAKQPNPAPATVGEVPERVWRIGVIVIFLVAAVLRLYDLNLVPLHHDEGVNGNFLVRLVREGSYQYDPTNYHGPTLYYFAAFFPWVVRVLFGKEAQETYGLTTVAIRFVPAFFGVATVVLIFFLRRRLGTIATLSAALLLAISPGAVYLSRYFIHETLFVFFTFGIVVAGIYAYDRHDGSFLILGSASAALLFATKETAMISAGVLIIAFAVTRVYMRLRHGKTRRPPKTKGRMQPEAGFFSRLVAHFGGPIMLSVWLVAAVIVFVSLYALFYSSFTDNPKGIYDSFETFKVWSNTGSVAHVHPFFTYFDWLLKREGPLLLLGVLGAAFVVLKPRNSLALFIALWAFGLIAAYSLIPYKTPWLLLNFVVPLAVIAGYAIQIIYEFDPGQFRMTGIVLLLAVLVSAYQTIDLNFVNYDNDDARYVYVYAHTTRGTLDLVKEIDRIAKEENGGLTGISILSPDYWPLPWYLRNFSRVGYYGRLAQTTEPILIANENQKTEIDANYGEVYEQVLSNKAGGSFQLRPGVELLLYHRRKGSRPPEPPLIPHQ
ncbi:MAG TPA: flippase activity-associated protein Agl23 [Pyrinomonadaceae bacterium]|nr:flippase activity-associated protein Agl23 [Pyrinomonadaceae bacterium]